MLADVAIYSSRPDLCWLLFVNVQQRVRESLPSGGAAGVKSGLSWVAGLVVVGDEILSGKVEDSNISFLCTKLYEIGWTVRKVRGLARSAAPATE